MTSYLIDYFIKYSKYDSESQNYYINNLKTVLEYHNIDPEQYIEQINRNKNEFTKEMNKSKYQTKRTINEDSVNEIIELFNTFRVRNVIYNDVFKMKFEKYILYKLEKEQTKTSHQANRYIKNKKLKEWFTMYDMNFNIINSCIGLRLKEIERNIYQEINYRISDGIFEIIDNNEQILKNFIANLSEKSKDILIDQIVECHQEDIIKRVSDKINKNDVVNKISHKIVNDCNKQIKNDFNNKINEFMKSEDINNIYAQGLETYFYNTPIEIFGNRIDRYAQKIGIYKSMDDKLNKINSTIKELKLQYLNSSNSSNNNSNNSSESSNDNSESSEINEINENSNMNFDKCFVKHGKSKYNLKLGELMKLSNIEDIKEFKKTLIEKNIIKKDFDLAGSTYRLTEQQKKQLINDFTKFVNN